MQLPKRLGDWLTVITFLLTFIACIIVCVIPALGGPPYVGHVYEYPRKAVVGYVLSIDNDMIDEQTRKTLPGSRVSVGFWPSGEKFPEDGAFALIQGRSEVCGPADTWGLYFKIYPAETTSGLLSMSFRGIQPMGSEDCPAGEFLPYPHYDPSFDPDGFRQKINLFQQCLVRRWSFDGLVDEKKCLMTSYDSFPNIVSVGPPADSQEFLYLITISDDGINVVPASKIPDIVQMIGGRDVSNEVIRDIVDDINSRPDNDPVWDFLFDK
jgi:hypothetical protein